MRQPPAPATWPKPAPTHSPAKWSRSIKIWIGVAVGVIVLLASIGAGVSDKTDSGSGGSFYASAGWTISRAADLAVKIQYDDGVSRVRSDCAMKAIVYDTTWLEWQAKGSGGQLHAIRAAEAGC